MNKTELAAFGQQVLQQMGTEDAAEAISRMQFMAANNIVSAITIVYHPVTSTWQLGTVNIRNNPQSLTVLNSILHQVADNINMRILALTTKPEGEADEGNVTPATGSEGGSNRPTGEEGSSGI